MNTPSSSAPDPLSDEGLESRLLHGAAPAPLDSALMQRLRLARPPLPLAPEIAATTSAASQAAHGALKIPLPRRLPANFWKPMAAAAAIALCAWAGWRATAPDVVSHSDSPIAQNSPGPADPADPEPELEFLPSQESRQHLLSVKDLGVIRDSRERPVRLVSTTWLDENTYGDSPADPALRESRLRHEIVPVLLPTY